MLTIDPRKVFFIMVKAREFDAKVDAEELDSGSNPTDDAGLAILEDYADDPTYEELLSAIASLNEEELDELQALVWVGRGDFSRDEWAEALELARDSRDTRTPQQLTAIPLLSDYIEEGMSQLGHSLEDYEIGRL
ncbi:MAG: DUF3775 domain-containing protein [Proteobacteria bacterium]|nr:DUF3775 domain-containing protein [Pseudomonadota bacterium]